MKGSLISEPILTKKKVPNHSPEQKSRISCLLLRAENSNLLLSSDLSLLVGNGTKVKIPSEIKPPLGKHCQYWNVENLHK